MPVSAPNDEGHFQVHSRLEVLAILRGLMEQAALVTLYFGTEDDFIVTTILGVHSDEDALILDLGADDAANQRALAASSHHAVSQLDHIRVEFEAEDAEEINYDRRPALRVLLPSMLTRLQRREAYRLKVPINRAVHLRVPASHSATGSEVPIRVFDISITGFALVDVPGTVKLVPGAVLKDCKIVLPDIGAVPSDIEIVHCIETTLPNARTSCRYGCRFVNLSAATATLIQRYINRIGRDQIAHG